MTTLKRLLPSQDSDALLGDIAEERRLQPQKPHAHEWHGSGRLSCVSGRPVHAHLNSRASTFCRNARTSYSAESV